MVNRHQTARRRLVLLMDAASIAASMLLAFGLHAILRSHVGFLKEPPAVHQYLLLAYLTMPMMLGLIALLGLHREFERAFRQSGLLWNLLRLHAVVLLGVALLLFLTQVPFNRSIVGLFLLLTFTLMWLSRTILEGWRRRMHAAGHGRAHLLLVGDEPDLIAAVAASVRDQPLAPEVVGVLASGRAGQTVLGGVPVLGAVPDLPRVLHEHTVDEVVIATHALTSKESEALMAACDEQGKPVRLLVLPEVHAGRRVGLEWQYGLPFVSLARTERSTEALAVKRLMDLLGAAVLVLILGPVMLLVAALILVTMGRPVLFGQERIGHHGRRFRMLKFRSMIPDAERRRDELASMNEADGPVFKIARDPRITPLGRLLRKYSLDELPQLFNVLAGSMSLVGPRPLPVVEQQQITGASRRRLAMRPGITGPWQVSGRSDLCFSDWMQRDLDYVDNWSILQDLKLLLRTIPAVIVGRGAR
jgi:exopolysaccharide biosynthesis polyprenyl glycosylphosphotransferase